MMRIMESAPRCPERVALEVEAHQTTLASDHYHFHKFYGNEFERKEQKASNGRRKMKRRSGEGNVYRMKFSLL